jgi:hypothetical protein
MVFHNNIPFVDDPETRKSQNLEGEGVLHHTFLVHGVVLIYIVYVHVWYTVYGTCCGTS